MRTHSTAKRPEPVPETTPAGAQAPWERLLEAASDRFPEPEYLVTCDDRHTIWVKRADGTRSVGLSQWLLRRSELEEILQGAEKRLNGRPRPA
jgi:hypothetical protein